MTLLGAISAQSPRVEGLRDRVLAEGGVAQAALPPNVPAGGVLLLPNVTVDLPSSPPRHPHRSSSSSSRVVPSPQEQGQPSQLSGLGTPPAPNGSWRQYLPSGRPQSPNRSAPGKSPPGRPTEAAAVGAAVAGAAAALLGAGVALGLLLLLLLRVSAAECAAGGGEGGGGGGGGGSAAHVCTLGAAAGAAAPVLGAACCAGALCAVSCASLLRRLRPGLRAPVAVATRERRRGSDAATLV